jgi:hypothetical protein
MILGEIKAAIEQLPEQEIHLLAEWLSWLLDERSDRD